MQANRMVGLVMACLVSLGKRDLDAAEIQSAHGSLFDPGQGTTPLGYLNVTGDIAFSTGNVSIPTPTNSAGMPGDLARSQSHSAGVSSTSGVEMAMFTYKTVSIGAGGERVLVTVTGNRGLVLASLRDMIIGPNVTFNLNGANAPGYTVSGGLWQASGGGVILAADKLHVASTGKIHAYGGAGGSITTDTTDNRVSGGGGGGGRVAWYCNTLLAGDAGALVNGINANVFANAGAAGTANGGTQVGAAGSHGTFYFDGTEGCPYVIPPPAGTHLFVR